MVIGDINPQDSSVTNGSARKGQYYPARVLDRILSVVIDVSIFFPVAGTLSIPLLKKYESLALNSSSSTEYEIMILLLVSIYLIYWVAYQALCVHFMQATIGQRAVKVYWASLRDHADLDARVEWSQAATRTFLWIFQAVCLPWTMFEIMGHRRRQLLADRATEVVMVSPILDGDSCPAKVEIQFFRHLVILVTVMVGMMAQSLWITSYVSVLRGDYQQAKLEDENYLCKEVSNRTDQQERRSEVAAVLFLTNQISAECVSSEADFLFWNLETEGDDWASYLKGLVYEADGQEEQKEKYYAQACEDKSAKSEVCRLIELSTNMSDKNKTDEDGAALVQLKNAIKSKNADETEVEQKVADVNLKNLSDLQKLVWYKNQKVKYGKEKFVQVIRDFLSVDHMHEFAQQEYVKHLWAMDEKKASYEVLITFKDELGKSSLTQLKNWFCSQKSVNCGQTRSIASEESSSNSTNWLDAVQKSIK